MRWLLVDHVETLLCNESVEAVCLPFGDAFPGHFPERPMVPGAFVLEALSQAGTILLEASGGFARKAMPVLVERAKFRRPVHPAEPMRVSMTCLRRSEEDAVLSGTVAQDGVICCTAQLGFAFAPLAGFFGPDTLPHYHRVYRRWLAGARLGGFERSPREVLHEAL